MVSTVWTFGESEASPIKIMNEHFHSSLVFLRFVSKIWLFYNSKLETWTVIHFNTIYHQDHEGLSSIDFVAGNMTRTQQPFSKCSSNWQRQDSTSGCVCSGSPTLRTPQSSQKPASALPTLSLTGDMLRIKRSMLSTSRKKLGQTEIHVEEKIRVLSWVCQHSQFIQWLKICKQQE